MKITSTTSSPDKDSVKKAIKQLKRENKADYLTVCNYVDEIIEDRCIKASKDTAAIGFIDTDSCYLKGSKVVLIKPLDQREDLIEIRKEAILKSAKHSKEFWDTQ